MLTSGTVSINLLFMNEQFQFGWFSYWTINYCIQFSTTHVNTLHFYHFIKTNLLLPTVACRVHKGMCASLSNPSAYLSRCTYLLTLTLHGLTEQSNLLCTQVSWGQVYLWEQQVHITCISGLRYTSTSWSVVTEWFTHTLLLGRQTQAYITTLAGIWTSLACLCQCLTDFICALMNSLNAPILTIVLSVKILHGSEETSWSQEIHLKAEWHCQEQTMSHI